MLPVYSPSKELFYRTYGITPELRPDYEQYMLTRGGFEAMFLGMMVHETYHVREGEDAVRGLVKKRGIPEDRGQVRKDLASDPVLRSLIGSYARIVFAISDDSGPATRDEKLADLAATIAHLKVQSPATWNFIWDYEYVEGFAEYVSASSMVNIGHHSLAQEIALQKTDTANNFVYRTGTLGGFALASQGAPLPFAERQDHRSSLWELVIAREGVSPSSISAESLETKYVSIPFDLDQEIGLVTEYLISTMKEVSDEAP